MDDQEKEQDKDDKDNQDSKPDPSPKKNVKKVQKQNDNKVDKALQALDQKKFKVSGTELGRSFERWKQHLWEQVLPNPEVPPKPFRPPTHPETLRKRKLRRMQGLPAEPVMPPKPFRVVPVHPERLTKRKIHQLFGEKKDEKKQEQRQQQEEVKLSDDNPTLSNPKKVRFFRSQQQDENPGGDLQRYKLCKIDENQALPDDDQSGETEHEPNKIFIPLKKDLTVRKYNDQDSRTRLDQQKLPKKSRTVRDNNDQDSRKDSTTQLDHHEPPPKKSLIIRLRSNYNDQDSRKDPRSHLDQLKPPKKRKIPERLFVEGTSSKGIVIKEQKQEMFTDYRGVFDNTEPINMEQLSEINANFYENKGTRSRLRKIYAALHGGKDKIFRNIDFDSRNPKMSFLDWVNSSEDNQGLALLKERAVFAACRVTCEIIDIMFLMSLSNVGEMGAKFQVFEDSLGWVTTDEKISLVIPKILDVIKAVENQLRRLKFFERRESKGKEVMNERIDMVESFIDATLHLILEEILRMELFWVEKRLPCSARLLVDELPLLEEEIFGCETSLLGLDKQIKKGIRKGKFGVVESDWKERFDYVELEFKMAELWNCFEVFTDYGVFDSLDFAQ
ncbi:uncharacterized protein LOC126680401 [Mercurialis annua]|uniref:uncharacterized protein LOC126680401 n=1 Tax=Mercurialis annua TaxID=3986 RepID=UPI00215E2C0B|nr:uncharacterized protein LOC126680401 [Mercurialis annua]